MLVNGKITHYHIVKNKTTKIDEWVRYNYDNIHFIGGKGSSFNKGIVDSNYCKIRIWYDLNDVDINNFKLGDILVKGHIEKNIVAQSDLLNYETYNIKSIVNNDNLIIKQNRHIHIEGK